jgi:hypothetical protein
MGVNAPNRQMFQTVVEPGRFQAVAPRLDVSNIEGPPQLEEVQRDIFPEIEERRRARAESLRIPLVRGDDVSHGLMDYRIGRKREFRRKLLEHRSNTALGVNIPQLSQKEMQMVREGLIDLFKTIINLMMKEFQRETTDWDDWQAFEGAYEEAMHLLRMHIIKAVKRNPATLHGERKINPTVQKVRTEQSERLFAQQDLRRRLAKLTSMLQGMDTYQDSTTADRVKQNRVARELEDFVGLIDPEARKEVFGENNLRAIWDDLNSSPDHRKRVIDWLEAKLMDTLADEKNQVMKRFQAWKVQDTYRISKSAAMKRFINKKESPPC